MSFCFILFIYRTFFKYSRIFNVVMFFQRIQLYLNTLWLKDWALFAETSCRYILRVLDVVFWTWPWVWHTSYVYPLLFVFSGANSSWYKIVTDVYGMKKWKIKDIEIIISMGKSWNLSLVLFGCCYWLMTTAMTLFNIYNLKFLLFNSLYYSIHCRLVRIRLDNVFILAKF